mgnify:CR=1 FL=1
MNQIYLCSGKLAKQLGIKSHETGTNHKLGSKNNKTFLWPNNINHTSINPETFIRLKEKHKITMLLIIDRLQGKTARVKTTDHINKTGKNFLIGKTPYNNRPTFPDMSDVYKNTKGKVFISYGKGFKRAKERNKKYIESEWIAPIATVWRYVGVEIVGLGVGEDITRIESKTNDS